MNARLQTHRRGFTLIELLVVITIIALISAVALPTILPALNERRISEAARILQATLAGTRDAAIRSNTPKGIRLLPDPAFNGSSYLNPATQAVSYYPLASNRMIPIEPGPDYTEGLVSAVLPGDSLYNKFYLTIAESPFTAVLINGAYQPIPNNPTNWSLNVRQGDKLRFNDSGAYYTVAGPINGPPFGPSAKPVPPTNSERAISCFPASAAPLFGQTGYAREFLYLMNGQDDNGNGWIDEACDGIDNDGDGITDPGFNGLDDNGDGNIDEPAELGIGVIPGAEFEQEVFVGSQSNSPPTNIGYTIFRRPVVSPGARETTLPEGIVIDLTTYNVSAATNTLPVLLPERSRLPVDAFTGYVDIMIDQTGRVIPPGAGMDGGGSYGNSPLSNFPFYHFWLTEREGVVPPLFGFQSRTINGNTVTTSIPAVNTNYGSTATSHNYVLPMPGGTVNYPTTGPFLTGERRLVTLFVKTGQITSNSITNFNGYDTNTPFYDAQAGTKESQ